MKKTLLLCFIHGFKVRLALVSFLFSSLLFPYPLFSFAFPSNFLRDPL